MEGILSGGSVERRAMRVAGFGFRNGAGVESLLGALDAAGGAAGLDAIATVEAKAGLLGLLGDRLGLTVTLVPVTALTDQPVRTQSDKSHRLFGTGSLSEAVALYAAGAGAELDAIRAISPDKMATCAIATGGGR